MVMSLAEKEESRNHQAIDMTLQQNIIKLNDIKYYDYCDNRNIPLLMGTSSSNDF